MADVAEATTTPAEEPKETSESIKFGGTTHNLVPGMAMLLASIAAYFMGMTQYFFVEAIAWVFMIWGALLIYAGLIDIYETFEVTDDALVIRDVMRPWNSRKEWDWAHIDRLTVLVNKRDTQLTQAKMQIYFTPEGELGLEREDRAFDPRLAELIVERAGLKPAGPDNPASMDELPLEQNAEFTWRR